MEELLARITAKTGVDREPARKAIAIIVNHLNRHAKPEQMQALFAAVPGSANLIEDKKRKGFGALFGNSLVGVWADLKGTGLSTAEMNGAGKELLAYAEEKLGKDAVRDLGARVPGLKAYL